MHSTRLLCGPLLTPKIPRLLVRRLSRQKGMKRHAGLVGCVCPGRGPRPPALL